MSAWAPQLLLFVPLCIFTHAQERVELRADHELTCGQAAVLCEVKSGGPTCMCEDDHVYVSSLNAYIVECQKQKTWSLCLKILLDITVSTDVGQSETDGSNDEESAELHEEEHEDVHHQDHNMTSAASVRVCYTYTSQRHSKSLRFTYRSSAFDDSNTLKVWMSLVVEIPMAELGGSVIVHSSNTNATKHVIIPSKEEVCSTGADAVFCEVAPRLRRRTNRVTGAVVLYVADADKWRLQKFSACQRLDRNGGCLKVEWDNASREFELVLGSVAPCLCFEIWGNFPRTEYCPFLNETAILGSSVSVSLSEAETHHQRPAVVWSITAPCRLEARLWLCVRDGLDRGCHAVNSGSHVQTRLNDSWIQTDHRHWELQGEFVHVERHPSLCVQVTVAGMDGDLAPVCPFEVRRKHWIFPLVLCVLLMSLSVTGAYAVQGWVFRWLKVDDVNLVSCGAELLLVSPPDADGSMAELLCCLSSSLAALGFSVTLDLWSHSEISAIGAGPWLHSCLDQVLQRGGKALLVLTQTACEWAEDWSCQGAKPEEEKETLVNRGVQLSMFPEVFDASLTRILADRLLSRAAGRYVLVQFDGRCPATVLPEFLRGLPVFILPSQSLDFITELIRGPRVGRTATGRWDRARAMRAASRALTGALRENTAGTEHTWVMENTWDTVPLQTDPSSPALRTNTSTVGWV